MISSWPRYLVWETLRGAPKHEAGLIWKTPPDCFLFFPFRLPVHQPGFHPDLVLKRMPRVLNEPDTRRMGLQVAKGLAERGVVRLVRVAAGVPT